MAFPYEPLNASPALFSSLNSTYIYIITHFLQNSLVNPLSVPSVFC